MFTAAGEGQLALLSLFRATHGLVMQVDVIADHEPVIVQLRVGLPVVFGLQEPATELVPALDVTHDDCVVASVVAAHVIRVQGLVTVALHTPVMLHERVGVPVQPASHVPATLLVPAKVTTQVAWLRELAGHVIRVHALTTAPQAPAASQ